jgi:flavodoxin
LFLGRVRCEECTMFYCERAVEFDMKSLIVYFSRTGNTRKVAEAIHGLLGGDLVEIREAGGRGGPIGWLRSGMESIRKMLPRLQPIEKEPSSYDLVVVGTPIWASNMSSPVRAFITRYREEFPRTAFFCTGDGDDPALVFGPMLELLGREPVATVGIIGEERGDDLGMEKIATFVEALKEAL